ncbi:hypothetical protein SAMN02982929_03400 [Saccharopolyspora kobensis]|uniref:Uncharacterized protein n=1 Tax=Saccharopolyspora kobensis TaxID=146035 RepID=A0A1H6CFS5_9PSEU|nr:hypothetical protein [Saccharopolyspora kobensis]SEG71870.1 hypothetical protein SAMN02982929_03400 [Saccharopolyspora kobensis]SFC39195.1 hypothetical protein SAMN05216506_101642 [Saccharopolyspora kobensis]
MPNPLAFATPTFWNSSQKIDDLLAQAGSQLDPITFQLQRVASIDTDEILRAAESGWGLDPDGRNDDTSALTKRLSLAIDNVLDARERAGEIWQGQAAEAFRKTLEGFRDSLQLLQGPSAKVGETLKKIKEEVDQSIFDVMAQVGSVGSFVGGILSLTGGLAAAPEPLVTKVLAIVGGIIAVIVGIIGMVTNLVKAEYEKFDAIRKSFDAAISLQRAIP